MSKKPTPTPEQVHEAQEIVNSTVYTVKDQDGVRFKESLLVPMIAQQIMQLDLFRQEALAARELLEFLDSRLDDNELQNAYDAARSRSIEAGLV